MNFRKKYSKVTVAMAMLHGVIIGIAAVAIVGAIIISTNGSGKEKALDTEVVTTNPPATGMTTPTSGPAVSAEDPPLQLFAKQHGVFSTAQTAHDFVSQDASLSKAAILEIEGQFYVWSAVGLREEEIEVSEYEGTFRKPFFANASTCSNDGAGKLTSVLSETELSKIKILTTVSEAEEEDEKLAEFRKNIAAVTAFSSDLRIIRLQLLSHYTHKDGCVKINF
ncbi:hypothetical protein MHZ92_12760 [Sporosarcina sp. ACRSL]|uniref:hypothetical protein n=1 Tax=Sporosarcina sp. ACRSL TaxID=2918215 RepID=UPI001EF593AD|nr:hypothetical protein [Sporosarcina sp. ACRSL]MCG7345010.1 hypothetical protein [Sporosarcina sp. ACRSL]